MKKILILLSVIIIVAVIVSLFFLRSSSGFRSIYMVPNDAVLLIESNDPLKAWDNVVHSDVWTQLSSNPFLEEVNSQILKFDSLVNDNKTLMKLVGKKPILISQHLTGHNEYELLYVIELGKAGIFNSPEKLLKTFLSSDDYEITTRDYNQNSIIEILDLTEKHYYFLATVNGKLIFSYNPKIVEASIDASEKKILGRDSKFLDVYSKLANSGLVSLYINHNNLGSLINTFSSEIRSDISQNKQFQYSGLSFDITPEGLISLEGYSSLSDSIEYTYKDLFHNGNIELYSSGVIPLRLASLVKMNFKSASDYFHTSMHLLGNDEYKSRIKELEKIEKRYKISIEDNFFSWMDKEIVLLQTKPSNLGRSNEFAAIIHAKDSVKAADNLSYLWKQIKRNSPVKIKSVKYKGYQIDYVAFPGFLKMLFGKLLDKIEKPYFSQIGKQVIISNHPQTIKNLIDDYLSKSTINTSEEYGNFMNQFSNKTAFWVYIEPPVLYYNMKSLLSAESWKKLQKNKNYFTCFNQAGIVAELSDDLIHFQFKTLYKPEIEKWQREYYSTSDIISLFKAPMLTVKNDEPNTNLKLDTIPKIIIHTLDAEKQTEYFDNGTIKREMELKNGQLHGSFREYHLNGKSYIKGNFDKGVPTGKWKYYDEEGKPLKTDKY